MTAPGPTAVPPSWTAAKWSPRGGLPPAGSVGMGPEARLPETCAGTGAGTVSGM
jgi:hypothetical protein